MDLSKISNFYNKATIA